MEDRLSWWAKKQDNRFDVGEHKTGWNFPWHDIARRVIALDLTIGESSLKKRQGEVLGI